MKHRAPSETERLFIDIDTIVEKLGNIAVRAQDMSMPMRNQAIRYLQAELRYLKLGGDIREEELKIRNLRSMIGMSSRKYRGE